MRGRRLLAVVAAMALATQAQAQVKPCWDAPAIGAARTAEFQTMLMVVSLRCRTLGIDFRDGYDRFVTVQKNALGAAHDILKTRFGLKGKDSAKGGDYDRFLTGVANFYGVGKTESGVCRQFEAVLGEVSRVTADADHLASMVMQMIRDPHLDADRCPVTVAKK